MIFSKYEGKFFSILGDSISTLSGYNPPECAVYYDWEHKLLSGVYTPSDTWWGRVLETLGGQLLVNNAWSGSMVSRHPAVEIDSYGCSDGRTGNLHLGQQKPDVVLVLLGLNDWGAGMYVLPTAQKNDLSVFSVAYGAMLEKIKRNYPDAEIWCLTLPISCWSMRPEVELPACRAGGHIADYCKAIRDCARQADCPVVDIFNPQRPYDTIDGYHPTAGGMKTIADAVLAAIEGWCRP